EPRLLIALALLFGQPRFLGSFRCPCICSEPFRFSSGFGLILALDSLTCVPLCLFLSCYGIGFALGRGILFSLGPGFRLLRGALSGFLGNAFAFVLLAALFGFGSQFGEFSLFGLVFLTSGQGATQAGNCRVFGARSLCLKLLPVRPDLDRF